MAHIGVMIEGQEGLTWQLWRDLCQDVEALGLDSLWRSDHLLSVMAGEGGGRDCIETWVSLALAAEWTSRIEFGPLVSPVTFRPPAILARMAATVDQLSGGRLVLGVGAGWNQVEHDHFGIELPPLKERMDKLERDLPQILSVLAEGHPSPSRSPLPILIGGSGEKRTLRLVARHAVEWNFHGESLDSVRHKLDVLDRHCEAEGRDRGEIRLSMMCAFVAGRSRDDLLARAERLRFLAPGWSDLEAPALLERLAARWYVGTPEEIAEKLRPYVELGVSRFMLQHFLMDDRDALPLLVEVQRLLAQAA